MKTIKILVKKPNEPLELKTVTDKHSTFCEILQSDKYITQYFFKNLAMFVSLKNNEPINFFIGGVAICGTVIFTASTFDGVPCDISEEAISDVAELVGEVRAWKKSS